MEDPAYVAVLSPSSLTSHSSVKVHAEQILVIPVNHANVEHLHIVLNCVNFPIIHSTSGAELLIISGLYPDRVFCEVLVTKLVGSVLASMDDAVIGHDQTRFRSPAPIISLHRTLLSLACITKKSRVY